MSTTEEGGTKIQKRKPPPQQMGAPSMGGSPAMMPPPPQRQQMPPGMDQGDYQQMMMQQQMAIQQQMAAQQQIPLEEGFMPKSILKKKSKFGKSFNFSDFKLSVFVVLIFVLLNSKIIWKQITRLPLMGSTDPSIIALLVNSLLAGIAFYIVSTQLS